VWLFGINFVSIAQDEYDKIFETESRRGQFIKHINAAAIKEYYNDRQMDSTGISANHVISLSSRWLCPGSIPGEGHLSRHVTNHPGELSLPIPSWVGAVSVSQRAVMPCGWGVKASMVRVWVAGKTVWSPCYTRAERFIDEGLIYKAMYKFICLLDCFTSCSQKF